MPHLTKTRGALRRKKADVSSSGARRGPDPKQALEQGRHLGQRNHVGSIAERAFRVRMGFDKNAIGTRGDSGPGKNRGELALAAGLITSAAGQLNGMGGIKYHRKTETAHNGNRAHIGHEIIITERCASFRHENLAGAFVPGLCDYLTHFGGRKKLPFL